MEDAFIQRGFTMSAKYGLAWIKLRFLAVLVPRSTFWNSSRLASHSRESKSSQLKWNNQVPGGLKQSILKDFSPKRVKLARSIFFNKSHEKDTVLSNFPSLSVALSFKNIRSERTRISWRINVLFNLIVKALGGVCLGTCVIPKMKLLMTEFLLGLGSCAERLTL